MEPALGSGVSSSVDCNRLTEPQNADLTAALQLWFASVAFDVRTYFMKKERKNLEKSLLADTLGNPRG